MPIPPLDPAYPRDLAGYGEDPPHARWPGGARIAVQFVLDGLGAAGIIPKK